MEEFVRSLALEFNYPSHKPAYLERRDYTKYIMKSHQDHN